MQSLLRNGLVAAALAGWVVLSFVAANAQSGGSSTSITGVVLDPSGAVVPNAKVEIRNPVSGFDRTTATDVAGKFTFANVPFNPYHLAVNGKGFAPYAEDVVAQSSVPVNLSINLMVGTSSETVTVEALSLIHI